MNYKGLKKLLYFLKGKLFLSFLKTNLFLYFLKRNPTLSKPKPKKNFKKSTPKRFLILQETNIQNPGITELSFLSENGAFSYISENETFKPKLNKKRQTSAPKENS